SDQEKFKREQHPFDAYERLKEQAEKNEAPKPPDNFRWRYYGLFYVAPAQNSYMCRLRIPNGTLKHWQFAALADIAERCGGGDSHVTTRGNIQIRENGPKNPGARVEAAPENGPRPGGRGGREHCKARGHPARGHGPLEQAG